MLVYLDTNVFDNLVKEENGCTRADERRLRGAVGIGNTAVVASHVNLRETIATLRSKPNVARAQLQLIVSLANWHRFVRFSTQVLDADIRHFAYNGERSNSPFESDGQANHIRSVTQRIIDGHLDFDKLKPAIEEDEQYKRAFLQGVKACRTETEARMLEFRANGEIPSFEQFFQDAAEAHALAFVKSFGSGLAEQCEQRGLDKLLKIPSLRMMVGHGMSLIYRIAVDGKATKSSAARDLQHAVCAAVAADIFVTHDRELTFLLNRVPIKGFRVMRLSELFEELDRTSAPLTL